MAGSYPTRVILGPLCQVDVNSYPFRVLAGSIRDSIDVRETTDTDTDSICREHYPDGYRFAEVEFTIQLDVDPTTDDLEGSLGTTSNTQAFVGPLNFYPGSFVDAQVWPEGRNADFESGWDMTLLVKECVPTFTSRGSAPHIVRISGVTSGYYKRPYESYELEPSPPPVRPSWIPLGMAISEDPPNLGPEDEPPSSDL